MSNEVTNYNKNVVACVEAGVGEYGPWTENPHNVQPKLSMMIVDWMECYSTLSPINNLRWTLPSGIYTQFKMNCKKALSK